MPLLEPTAGDILRDHFPHVVYTRERWFEDWVEQKHLYANRVFTCCSPDIPSAELVWRLGEGMQPDKATFAEVARKSLLDHYVKIEIDQGLDEDGLPNPPFAWVGYILEESTGRGGAFLRGEDRNERVLTGEQAFLAYGLEIFLQQTMLETSWYWDSTAKKKVLLRRPLTFNSEHGYQVSGSVTSGNRTAAKEADDCYQFSDDLTTAKKWTTRDILEYLVQYMSPRAIDDTTYMTWKLSQRTKDLTPNWDEPVVQCAGRTLKSVLDQLLDRRRLFSYKLSVVENDEGKEEVELDAFPFISEALTLPGGNVQWPNEDTVELDFDRAVDVTAAVLRDSAAHKVEQVRVVGARKRSIFTISALDGTLEDDWKVADENAYIAGPAGIGGLQIDEQNLRKEEYFGQDRFDRVYSWFRLPADWDGFVGNGVGGTLNYFFPDDEELPPGDPKRRETFYVPDLRFERHLPREFWPIAPAGSPEALPPPIAMLKTEYPRYPYYQHVHRLSEPGGVEEVGDGSGRGWACSLQIRDDAPGIILRVHGGPGRHAFASADYVSTPGVTLPAELNWRNNLLATVMMQLDSHVEARYPETADLLGQPLDVARVATIDLGDKARLDWIVTGTVLDEADGVLVRTTLNGGYLRDDRDKMENLARLAYEWYGVKRQAFSFTFRQLSQLLSLGQIITKIGSGDTEEEVNSVVTGIQWDLVSGQTQVTTAFAEIDFVQL